MRHAKRINHLGRTSAHRAAMLSNMATSLIMHKHIHTTLAKAKELKKFVEPLIRAARMTPLTQDVWFSLPCITNSPSASCSEKFHRRLLTAPVVTPVS